ncbi:hypothetical protein GIB67_014592 [Kingdonia uniflora]|uniref:RNase H type-1 domain-containing protein n=1 Tax=Kingdonia uniflora TaxID=39325 RepID=A0A7J7MNZ5_9MAGN|nr:hypothetical protein GIB67_014592 [Kingdonia uniflora]
MGHRISGCTVSVEEDSSGIGARIQTPEDSLGQDTAPERGMPERNPLRPTLVYLGPTESGERGVNIANTRYSRKAKGKDMVGPDQTGLQRITSCTGRCDSEGNLADTSLWPPFTRRANLPGFENFPDPVQGGRQTRQLFFEEEQLTLQVEGIPTENRRLPVEAEQVWGAIDVMYEERTVNNRSGGEDVQADSERDDLIHIRSGRAGEVHIIPALPQQARVLESLGVSWRLSSRGQGSQQATGFLSGFLPSSFRVARRHLRTATLLTKMSIPFQAPLTSARRLSHAQGSGGSLEAIRAIMIIITWNCQGLGQPTAVRHLKELIRSSKGDIIFLSEAKRSAAKMCESWCLVESTAQGYNGPWLLLGDFNTILDNNDKLGGKPFRAASCAFAKKVTQKAGLIDLGFSGQPFTWNNKRWREDNIKERLDRCLANADWMFIFPTAKVFHLPTLGSDLTSLCLDTLPQYATLGILAFLQTFPPCISEENNVALVRGVTPEEIKAALDSIGSHKAPGPDRATGQELILGKSGIFFSKNLPLRFGRLLARLLKVKVMPSDERYLRTNLFFARSKAQTFHRICEHISSHLQMWNGKLLFQAGRTVLIKSVTSAIPTYQMSCFALPKATCKTINRLQRDFWWGKRKEANKPLYLKKWKEICRLKREGGLGIREAETTNKAYLSKLVWRLHQKSDDLWGQVLKAKYFPRCNILQALPKADASWTWRSIQSAIGNINTNSCWQIRTARFSSCRFTSSEEGEALAILGGVKWAREQGLTRVNMETDVEAIFSFCQTGSASISWSFKVILHDTLALYKHFENICISYTPRSVNSVARIIVGRSTNGNLCFSWFGSPPEWLQESFRSDGTTFVTVPIR